MIGKTPRLWVLGMAAYIMLATIYASACLGLGKVVGHALMRVFTWCWP